MSGFKLRAVECNWIIASAGNRYIYTAVGLTWPALVRLLLPIERGINTGSGTRNISIGIRNHEPVIRAVSQHILTLKRRLKASACRSEYFTP